MSDQRWAARVIGASGGFTGSLESKSTRTRSLVGEVVGATIRGVE